ncbi:Unknown protein [Striga hermonthica]|uniref:Uncharacterized protein n=1 Tax=Striga hermonthica TaxID=68872 RepID=A0A9N7NVE3_STRHE|nr:Unknown protein [Striga hermonthica]
MAGCLRHPNTVLDVPRIRKFEFNGPVVPELGFQLASKEWESHITISCSDFSGLTFGELSKLLTELTQSKIYLSLKVFMESKLLCNYEIEGLEGFPCRQQVEHLTVETGCHLPSLTSYAFYYDGLFRICRPKLVTQHQGSKFQNSNNDFLPKIFQLGTQGKFSSPGNFFYGLHDLEEVHVQPVDDDEVDAVWRLLTQESWSDITALAGQDDV